MAPIAARFFGDPTAELRVVGVTGTNGKTTTAYLVRALLEAVGEQCGLLGTVKSVVGGRRASGRPHDARGDRPAGRLPRDARRRRSRLRDGGLLARARAGARRRDSLRRGGVHQPHPGPPRLPRHDGGLLPGQAAPVRWSAHAAGDGSVRARAPRGERGQRRRPLRAAAGGGDRRRAHVRRGAGAADYSATDLRCGFDGCRFRLHTPEGDREVALAMPGRFNVANALGALAAVHALGRARRAAGRARAGRARAGALRAGRRGSGLRGARRLRPHARLARERAARGARAGGDRRARGGARAVRVRRRRRPRSRQAPADGRDRRAPGRRRGRHLRQPPLGGARADHRRDHGRRRPRRSLPARRRAGVGCAGRAVDRRSGGGDRRGDRARAGGRCARDRRQGPRAGAGVRRRAQGALRRRRRSPGRRCAHAGRSQPRATA